MGIDAAPRTDRARTPAGRAVSPRRKVTFAGRVPALDGLRGAALVAVLLYHAAPETLRGGFLGVEMFFVLSGFLLTALLLDEHRQRDVIDGWRYATRRLRRIFPALVVFLAVLAVAARILTPDDAHRIDGDILSSIAGVTNWHLIRDGSSYFAQTGRPPLVRHLWSIAVELQAYIVLPLVAFAATILERFRTIMLLVAGIVLSASWMTLLYESPDPSRAYYGTDTRISALLSGALIAVLVGRRRTGHSTQLTQRATLMLTGLSASALFVMFVVADERARWLYPLGFLMVQAATAGLIVASLRTGPTATALGGRTMRWLGTRSYGIYLWHWPLVALLRPGVDVTWPRPVTAVVTMSLAIALGGVSYRFVERPFLAEEGWARRPLPRPTRIYGVAWVAATLIIVALVARTSTVDPIAESLLEGERALAKQNEPAPATPATQKNAKSGTGAVAAPRPGTKAAAVEPGRLPPGSGPPRGSIKISAVGDSVMLGAAAQMKDRFGKSSLINAETNRKYSEGAQLVKDWRKAKRLGRVLIVHLGNNGPAKLSDIDAIVREAKPAEHILLVTVRVSKPWQRSSNDTIRAGAKKYRKVSLADWNEVSAGHPDWFYSDGTHVNRKGAEAYTKLIAAKIPSSKETSATSKPKATPKATPKPTPTPGLLEGIDPG